MVSNISSVRKGDNRFLSCRICWKVALATFLTILVVEAAILIPSYQNYDRDWKQNREMQVLSEVQGVLSSVRVSGTASVEEMIACLNILTRSMALLDWNLYESEDGQLLAQNGNIASPSFDTGSSSDSVHMPTGEVFDVVWRYDVLGVPYDIEARLSSAGLAPALKAFLFRILGLIAIISLFATVVTMFVLNRQVLRPVLNLRAHLQQAGDKVGDLQALITDTKQHDELGDVIQAFNDMLLHIDENLKTIKENERELQRAHDHLELRVQERTEALRQEVQERREVEQQLREKERTLYQSANYDELTRLPNRLLGSDRLLQALENAKRYGRVGALMFIDLDNFKEINDTMGHSMGDQLLIQTAERLSTALRGTDSVVYCSDETRLSMGAEDSGHAGEEIVARIGGDEFMVILPEITSEEDAAIVARRLSEACAKPFCLNNHEVFVTASIGIAVFPRDGSDQQGLMMSADTALYAVKDSGRNGYQFFSAEMNHRLIERLEIEAQLRYALDHEEFKISYQPIVDVKTQQWVGVEALLRWSNVCLGEVAPDDFIHVAEGTGLIIPIGEWVLNEACKAAKRLEKAGFPVRMALNVSARQFRGASFVDTVTMALAAEQLPAERLELEITESLLVDEQSEAVETIKRLRKLGIRLSIDDFGTGYSALSYLRRFDVNSLKIDRSFVTGIEHSEQDASLTRTIIAMAKNFGLEIIAEGVEEKNQLDFLALHDCDFAQGFYLGKPASFDEIIEMLQNSIAV